MASGENGTPHPQNVIVEKVAPVFAYLSNISKRINNITKGEATEMELSEEEEFQMLSVLIGNPAPKGNDPPATFKEFQLAVALRC